MEEGRAKSPVRLFSDYVYFFIHSSHCCNLGEDHRFLSPGVRFSNLTGPISYFELKVSRRVGCVLTSNEVQFVSLADNFTVQFSNLLKHSSGMENKQLTGLGNYRELRETGPRTVKCFSRYKYCDYNRISNEILDRDWFSAPICQVIGVQSCGCPITGIQFKHFVTEHLCVIRTSIARVLMDFFAKFPTVFQTYETRYIRFRSKRVRNF